MTNKISPNVVFKKKTINNFKKNLSLDNISLRDVSMDDLNLDNNENNFKEYYSLKFLLNSVSSCQMADAYFKIAKKSPVIYNLKSINNMNVYGKLFTCKTNSDDWGTSAIAIDRTNSEDILFILVNDDTSAIWGEIATRAAIKKGIKACVIYGSCRDVEVLSTLNLPIFALNIVPNAGSPLGLGEFNDNVQVDGRKISNDDFFFADENGVIVIEKCLFNSVIIETLSIKIKEVDIISKINEGVDLSEIVNL